MVCDFKIVKEAMANCLDQYDHAICMNTEDPNYAGFQATYGERVIGFTKTDPTTEVMAKTIYDICADALNRILGAKPKPAIRCSRLA